MDVGKDCVVLGKCIIPAEIELNFDDKESINIFVKNLRKSKTGEDHRIVLYVSTEDITNIHELLAAIKDSISQKKKPYQPGPNEYDK